nr:hypothetical protein [Burkholderia gladioli]
MRGHQRGGDAALETHRHQPAGAERRGGLQRAPVAALDRLGRQAAQVVREARAVEGVGEGDRRADAAQQRVLVEQPGRAQVPPAQRAEHAVEAGALEGAQRLARVAGDAGDPAHVVELAVARAQPGTPPFGRQALRRVDQEAGQAGCRERREAAVPPAGQRLAHLGAGDVGIGEGLFEGGRARVDARVVVLAFDIPVRRAAA